MLTKLRIRNFKRIDEIDIPLDKAVVLIGPNNSGKTTVLQALALWDIGIRRWNEKRGGRTSPETRPGVTINRRDLISIPVPVTNLLWHDLHVRNVEQIQDEAGKRKPKTEHINIDVIVDGITAGKEWSCGFEFDYANDESFYCRPLRIDNGKMPSRMEVPPEAQDIHVAFLPPMSGLAAAEPKWEPGRINVLLGEGQTSQVLRNLCYQIYSQIDHTNWDALTTNIRELFGVDLLPPEYITDRGEITMAYEEARGVRLDISSSGRGLQQTLLLLAHLYANPKTILLLDEPDAHLEILRQRQIYKLLKDTTERQGSQLIAASHSEVVLNEAANNDTVIAFVGKPHRIDDRGSQVLKSLRDIGFDHYYQAEQQGWILYVEDSTDLAILQAFAETLGHEAQTHLKLPFVQYVATNLPQKARDHFFGLREAKADLVGIALFDRLDKELQGNSPLVELMWKRREIENYFCIKYVLLEYARYDQPDNLFGIAERDKRVHLMEEAIHEITTALRTLSKPDPFSPDIKSTDDFLDNLFKLYFDKLDLPLMLRKSDYHILARLVPKNDIDPEVIEKLDAIVSVARKAKPRND